MIGIYKFENKINHNIYIGQSIDIERRYKDHLVRAKNLHAGNTEFDSPLHHAIRKYGIENFDFTIIEECKKEQLNDRERYWIEYYDSYKKGYNCTTGGDAQEPSVKFDEEFVNNIKKILLEGKMTYVEIHNQYKISLGRISDINQGRIWFDETLNYPLRKKKKTHCCIDCGKELNGDHRILRCQECSNKNRIIKSTNMPVTREELKQLIRTMPFTQIGQKFGYSDNAIRKWCIKLNLPSKVKEIKQYTEEEWAKI